MPWHYTTIAGPDTTNESGFVDGIGEEARFAGPCGMTRHPTNPWQFYVCDYHNNAIRLFDMITKEVTTVASVPHPAFIHVAADGRSIICCNPTPTTGNGGEYRDLAGNVLFSGQMSPRGCLASDTYYGSRNGDSLFGASVYGRFQRLDTETWLFGSWGGAFNNGYWFFGCAEYFETDDPERLFVCTADYFDEGGWVVWRDGSSYGRYPTNPPRRIISGGVHALSECADGKRLWVASGPYSSYQYIGRTTNDWHPAANGTSYANLNRQTLVSGIRPVSCVGHHLSDDICYFTDCSFEQLGSGGGSRTYVPGAQGYNRIGVVWHTDIGLFESGWSLKHVSIG